MNTSPDHSLKVNFLVLEAFNIDFESSLRNCGIVHPHCLALDYLAAFLLQGTRQSVSYFFVVHRRDIVESIAEEIEVLACSTGLRA